VENCDAFADDIDYAQLVKYYGNEPESQSAIVQPSALGHWKAEILKPQKEPPQTE
jgi:hypothetical protein